MKTFYWSFVLMLLPSMAYTQTTEKENEFSMSSDADDGRDTSVVFFLPSIGWFDNVRALEI